MAYQSLQIKIGTGLHLRQASYLLQNLLHEDSYLDREKHEKKISVTDLSEPNHNVLEGAHHYRYQSCT